MKLQGDEAGGRILLGDNTTGHSNSFISGSSILEFEFQLDVLLYTYILSRECTLIHIHPKFDLHRPLVF
jgi:hypothetical protein